VTVVEGAVTVVVVVVGGVVVDAVVAMADVPSPGLSITGSKTSEDSEVAADIAAAGCRTGDDADTVLLLDVTTSYMAHHRVVVAVYILHHNITEFILTF